MKSNHYPIITTLALLCGTHSSDAAVLANYLFNTNAVSHLNQATPVIGLTASTANLAFGSSVGTPTFTGGRTATATPIEGARSAFVYGNSIADSLVTPSTELVSFSLTPDAGQAITLTPADQISWKFQSLDAAYDSSAYVVKTKMQISSDASFATILSESSVFTASNNAPASSGRFGAVVTGTLNTSITSASSLYFRLVASDDTISSGNQQARFDDIIVNGSITAIPEPSAFLVGGLSLFGVFRRRRA